MNCALCGKSVAIIQHQVGGGAVLCDECMATAEPVPGRPGQYTIKKTFWRSIRVEKEPKDLPAISLVRLRATLVEMLNVIEGAMEDRGAYCVYCLDTGTVECEGCVGKPNEVRHSCAGCGGKQLINCRICDAKPSTDVRPAKTRGAPATEAPGPKLLRDSEVAEDQETRSET